MVKRAAAATSAWRQAVPFPLSDFFFDPDGVGVKRGREEEERLIHDIYFKAENGRPLEQVDTEAIKAKVLTSTGFEAESAVNPRQCQQGVVFYGRLSAPAPSVYSTIQARLDTSFPGLCAVLARDGIIRPAISVLIAPRQHLLSFSLPRPVFTSISCLTLTLSLLILSSSLSVDPTLSPTTSPLLTAAAVPLGVLLVAAAGAGVRAVAAQQHGVLQVLDTPLPLPSPAFGIITALFGRKQQHAVSMGVLAAAAVSLVLRPDGRENAATWLVLAMVLLKRDDWFQREEVSEPSGVRKLVAAALVAASILILWPWCDMA
ncbi:unnamed protein product [Closterium sp. Naga37s-1]|nr:unnamed protein product [Closterium sp. Naga37s-1]